MMRYWTASLSCSNWTATFGFKRCGCLQWSNCFSWGESRKRSWSLYWILCPQLSPCLRILGPHILGISCLFQCLFFGKLTYSLPSSWVRLGGGPSLSNWFSGGLPGLALCKDGRTHQVTLPHKVDLADLFWKWVVLFFISKVKMNPALLVVK